MENYYESGETLLKLISGVNRKEEKAVISGEFKDISNNDMHIIDAIGNGEPRSMSAVAKDLSVTVGTLTIAINNLVKKSYVKRVRSEKDRRVVLVSLLEKGRRAYRHHRDFHDAELSAVMGGISEDQARTLIKALTDLDEFFKNYGK